MAGLWRRLLGREDRAAMAPLYRAVVEAARRPTWFREGGVPDTIDGRFDMIAAVLSLVLMRFDEAGEEGREPAARLAELFVDDMDGQLRERGIGDIVVGKHVGRMMGALGGRLAAFGEAFGEGDLDAAIARNIYRGGPHPGLPVVRRGLLDLRAGLAALPAAALAKGEWPA